MASETKLTPYRSKDCVHAAKIEKVTPVWTESGKCYALDLDCGETVTVDQSFMLASVKVGGYCVLPDDGGPAHFMSDPEFNRFYVARNVSAPSSKSAKASSKKG